MGVRERTVIALVLVVNFIVSINSDSDVKTGGYDMDSLGSVDHLLRGSNEDRPSGASDFDIDEDDPSKNIEPEKVFDTESKEDREFDVGIVNPTAIDQRDIIRSTTEFYLTTEALEAIPEALGLRNEAENVDESRSVPTVDDNDYRTMELDRREESPTIEVEKEVIDGLINMSDTTEVTSDIASTIDNNVYRKTTEDVYSNRDNNVSEEITTSPLQTHTSERTSVQSDENAENLENLHPSADEDDTEAGGQRNPKTENSDQKQPTDKRNSDKPRPTPVLSKSSTLRSWLEDSWLRPPAGILVPLRPMALNRALAVWNDLTAEGLNVTDIVIVGYDSNGVNWRSRHNLQPSSHGNGDRAVAQALSKLLLKYQGVYSDATNDGTMRALASATKLVPYDSALFVVTDKGAGDPQRMPLALRALVEKRLKVYTIWTDPSYPSAESEQALQDLRNVSAHTEGEVLPYTLQVMDVDTNSNFATEVDLPQWTPMETQQHRRARVKSLQAEWDSFDTLLVRRGGGEAISVGIPIENGVSALRVFIEGAVDHAVLYPPDDGPQIDLYNESSVRAFSPASRTNALSPRDVYLVFPGAKLDIDMLSVMPATPSASDASTLVGLWHLSVRCDTCDYRLQVGALSRLFFSATVSRDTLKLRVAGPVASVRESVLVDEYGTELAKLPFNYQPMGTGVPEMESGVAELDADVPLPNVKASRVYAKIIGRDLKGEPFVRLSGPINQLSEARVGRSAAVKFPDSEDLELMEEENFRAYARLQSNDSNVLPFDRAVSQVLNQGGSLLTAVQVGPSTRLYGAPGDTFQLHFEVSNFRETAVRFQFGAVGQQRFLRGIDPAGQTISSGQTANVIVSVIISSNAQPGTRDLITFTAYGLEQVSISAYVYVLNTGEVMRDAWPPEVRHSFQGSCLGRQGSDCAEYPWSASIISRDAVSGLLRITSSPPGLVYESNFIAGTREEVTTTYRSTCCNPRVMINAVDALGNTNSYIVDISNYFTETAIASIVLGVILLIALIALLLFLVYWCVRRRKQTRELPSYNTSSRNIS